MFVYMFWNKNSSELAERALIHVLKNNKKTEQNAPKQITNTAIVNFARPKTDF